MTQDEIIRMAREAGLIQYVQVEKTCVSNALERFAALVAAHEREKLAEQKPFDMDDHPPHRLCECRKCMEYFTPLPDCDAFAASGKPIAEQPVSQEYRDHLVNQSFDWAAMAAKHQFMEGYRIGLAEMREKCATVSEHGTGEAVQKAALELLLNERKRIAAAIRAIKFEDDTGFRPVSEMVAEQEQAEQEPVAWMNTINGFICKEKTRGYHAPLYAAHVRTKDLTDEELNEIWYGNTKDGWLGLFRAVIAADREKNK